MTTVSEAARLVVRAGLAEAFGHVSDRAAALITTTEPLAWGQTIALEGAPDVRRPLEAPLHRAIYAARPDVGAIVRTHSPHAVAWGVRGRVPPLLHGLGALAGDVAVHDGVQLAADEAQAGAATGALGPAACLLLRANGALATGEDLPQALVRAWFLEERCRVATQAPDGLPLAGEALAERTTHTPAEQRRAWAWLQETFAEAVAA